MIRRLLLGWILLVWILLGGMLGSVAMAQASQAQYQALLESIEQLSSTVLERRIEVLKASGDDAYSGSAWYFQGRLLERERQFTAAAEAYSDYLRQPNIQVHGHEARIKSRLIRTGLRLNDIPGLAVLLAGLNRRGEGKPELALQEIELYLQSAPESPLADHLHNLAATIAILDLADETAAIRWYSALVQRYPASEYVNDALYGWALALEREGNVPEATRRYQLLKDRHTSTSLFSGGGAKDNVLSRLWYSKAENRLQGLRERTTRLQKGAERVQNGGLVLAMGDRVSVDQPIGSYANYRNVWELFPQYAIRPQHVVHWITRHSDTRWESASRFKALSKAGYTPVIAYWYFGDEISPDFVKQNARAYLLHIQEKLIPLIKDLPEVFILLEPEFNKNGIERWDGWAKVMQQAIRMIRREAPGAKLGLILGNWTDVDFEDVAETIEPAVRDSDFVGFQEMISTFDLRSVLGASWDPVDRSLRLSKRLQERFNKPIYFAYLAVSSFGGWLLEQRIQIQRFAEMAQEFAAHGVFAFGYFSLFDDPMHEGWFGEAERYFGLLDPNGGNKVALMAWRELEFALREQNTLPPKVLSALRFSPARLDFSRQAEVAGDITLNKWTRWVLRIKGQTSGAERHFSGSGESIHFRWSGLGEGGRFYPGEGLSFQLTADDVSGLRLEQIFPGKVLQTLPDSQTLLWLQASQMRRVNAWGESRLVKGDPLKLLVTQGPAGLTIPLSGFAWQVKPQQQWLQLQIKLSDGYGKGASLYLEDANGVQLSLNLEALINRPGLSNQWQFLTVPFTEFGTHGWVFRDGQAPEYQVFDWSRLQQMGINVMTQPIDVELKSVQVLQLEG